MYINAGSATPRHPQGLEVLSVEQALNDRLNQSSVVTESGASGTPRLTPSAPDATVDESEQVRPIANITELASIAPDMFAKVYVASLEIIHQSSNQDITDIISNTDIEQLQHVHKLLCANIVNILPQYGNRRTVNRVAKHKLVTDVINMGSSIVNCLDNKELSKIFLELLNKNSDICEETHQADLVQLVARLCDRVKVLEHDVLKLKQDNSMLQVQADQHDTHDSQEGTGDAPRPVTVAPEPNDEATDSETIGRDNSIVHANRFSVLAQNEETVSDQQQNTTSTHPGHTPRTTAAPKRKRSIQVYIGGVSGNTTESDIRHELVLLGIEASDITVRLHHHRDNWKSFEASVPKSMADLVYSNTAWPQGISVQPFRANHLSHKESNQRDQRQRDQRPREQQPRDQRPREQKTRDQRSRDQQPREQRPRDHQQRPRDQQPRAWNRRDKHSHGQRTGYQHSRYGHQREERQRYQRPHLFSRRRKCV